MRQLLSRMVDKDTEIEVVNWKNPNKPEIYDNLVSGFKQFFGREIQDYEKGTSNYVKELNFRNE